MPTDFQSRLIGLAEAAPWADLTLLRVLAALLAGEPGVEALLLVADALRFIAAAAALEGDERRRAGFAEMLRQVEDKARRGKGAFWG